MTSLFAQLFGYRFTYKNCSFRFNLIDNKIGDLWQLP